MDITALALAFIEKVDAGQVPTPGECEALINGIAEVGMRAGVSREPNLYSAALEAVAHTIIQMEKWGYSVRDLHEYPYTVVKGKGESNEL